VRRTGQEEVHVDRTPDGGTPDPTTPDPTTPDPTTRNPGTGSPTQDRATAGWPVGLGTVLSELARHDEVVVDLGPHGRLVVRRAGPHPSEPDPAGGAGATTGAGALLDPRSREALHLAGTGLPAVGIAEALGTDLADVAVRLAAVRAALGVSSTAAAVAACRGADGEVRGSAQR